jgi:transcriptional regulator with XRE-family HTH domain
VIGARIKERRVQCGLSQNEVAKALQVTQGAVSQSEKDITRPDFQTFEDLADVLDTTLVYLLGKTDNPHRLTTEELSAEYEKELERELIYWSLSEKQREDQNRRKLFLLAKNGSQTEVKTACILIDALRAAVSGFYSEKEK